MKVNLCNVIYISLCPLHIYHGGLTANSLNHVLDVDAPETSNNDLNNTKFLLINHSPYYDREEFIQHHCNNSGKFSVLSVNVQSLRAKYNEFTILLKHLQNQGCDFSVICIQETWLPDNYDTIDLLLDGFNLVTQGTKCSSHAGLAIFVKTHFNFTILPMYDSSDVWEGLFIELKNNFHKSVVIGNIYRPPRDVNINYQTFIKELTPILSAFEKRKAGVVLAGDFNITS